MSCKRTVLAAAMTAATLLSNACADPLASSAATQPAFGVNGAGKLAVYNGGLDRAAGATPCLHDERHRALDFWVGSWEMGVQRSVVRSLLDGCMIEENYMPPAPPTMPGGPFGEPAVSGRSINAYDRDTGRWHQTWITFSPQGHLRMSGGFDGTSVTVGTQAGGFMAQYSYRPLSDSQVLQSWVVFGSPGSLTYTRLAGVALAAPAPFPFCQPGTPIVGGDTNREIDFLEGDWDVRTDAGVSLGIARFAADMNGCLMREDYNTPRGYAAHSYIYFDLNTRSFHRTYIDSEAERAELFGRMVEGALVLRGAEARPGGRVMQVRNTFRPVDAETVLQTWEVAEDGVNWMLDMSLTFTRR